MTKASRGSSRAAPKDEAKPARGRGRPVVWTPAKREVIVKRVCDAIANCGTLFDVCPRFPGPDADVPAANTFLTWLQPDQPKGDDFAGLYARARAARLVLYEEQLHRSSFDGSNDLTFDPARGWIINTEVLGRTKIISENLKWMLAKLDRKRFGDALDLTTDGAPIGVVAMPGIVPLGAPLDTADVKPAKGKQKAKRAKRAA